ncbi:ATP synthase d subunit [Cystobasidiomycetes sp. EMM_F5]
MPSALDWGRVTSNLGLQKETLAALNAFRKRHADAAMANQQVKELKADVDFAHYKQVLKNQSVVSELEKTFTSFKPVDYDVQAQIKAIGQFQERAVDGAKKAAQKVDQQLSALNATLKDIESARPVEDLTTADVARARPQLISTTEAMVKNGKWTVPGYTEKFGSMAAL